MTRKSVMDKIKKEVEAHTIQILGSEKDKDDAFYILMNTQQSMVSGHEIYHGIKNSTLELLKNAEIKFKILGGGFKMKKELEILNDIFEDNLNDIFEDNLNEFPDCRRTFELQNRLKAEAIKWIKKDEFDLENADIGAYNIIDRWKERLNITEEDLK